MLNIEFGCGPKHNKGFVGCDIRSFPHVKYKCKSWEIQDLYNMPNNSVDTIYSRHFIEHLTFFDFDRTLRVWYNILKPAGRLMIVCPDLLFHIEQWLMPNRKEVFNISGSMSYEEWAMKSFYGHQHEVEAGEDWDIHKSGYDMAYLTDKLEAAGFKNIIRRVELSKNLNVECTK